MSLQVDDGHRRSRSKSPGGRGRERSRSRGPPIDTDVYDRERERERERDRDHRRTYEEKYESYTSPRSPVDDSSYRRSRETVDVKYSDGRREKEYRYEKEQRGGGDRERDRDRDWDRDGGRDRDRDGPRDRDRNRDHDRDQDRIPDDRFSYLPQKYAKNDSYRSEPDRRDRDRHDDRERERDRDRDREPRPRDSKPSRRDKYDEDDLAYGSGIPPHAPSKYGRRAESPPSPPSNNYAYDKPKQWEYAKVDSDRGPRGSDSNLGVESRRDRAPSPGPGYREKKYSRDSTTIMTVEPGARKGGMARERSPAPPTQRMSSLSVNTGLGVAAGAGAMSLAAAPGSPLLESYHGTYQSMSPMPSPLLLASHGGHEVMDVSPIGSEDERGGGKKKRRARFHDPEDDAARLAKALKGDKHAPDTAPLIEILPGLTQEQVMELRVEYKRLVKTGPDKKGVNVAKHIRARLKDADPTFMKACYSTALGRWESEAYWANFWYQGDKTRRELLIESLMGRSNDEIREIKEGFNDKKYDNSLIKCMKTELKEDKFKKAVLLVLEEKRMEDHDRYGRPLPLDALLVEEDARALYKAVRAEKGGETAMINIVVQRSDTHLREVLKLYNAEFRANFARDALKKSGNLVGELLAHILNGVINKPVRDALLLHHALTASKKDELRRELLISRLVRYHWDRHHMAAVKAAYRERYGKDLQEAVRDATSESDWGQFCRELCIARMPDSVKKVERIEIKSSR